MSLDLDPRQRAMLQEMGVRLWWPQALTGAPHEALAQTPTQTAPVHKSQVAPTIIRSVAKREVLKGARLPGEQANVAVLADGIGTMDGPTLARTIATCQACQLACGRRTAVSAVTDAPLQADWLVVGEPPDEDEERAGAPFAAQAGQLLDNMLKALKVSRHEPTHSGAAVAYVTNVVKCRPAPLRNPTAQELATCENYLRREVALLQPRIILALGRFAAHTVLRASVPDVASMPLGKLRGSIYRYQGIPVVVTYHPTYLLHTPQHKARAWADLCLALEAHQPRSANASNSASGNGRLNK